MRMRWLQHAGEQYNPCARALLAYTPRQLDAVDAAWHGDVADHGAKAAITSKPD